MSWGGRNRVFTPSSGEAGAPQVVNVGGTIVVDFMTNENGGGSGGVDGGEMMTVTSTDGGHTYSGPTIVGPIGSHWPGMLSLSSNSFLAMFGLDGVGMISQIWNI